MEPTPLAYYLPILSSIIAISFATRIFKRWNLRGRTANHLLWWGIGAITYAIGTLTESYSTLVGVNPTVFKMWYISGAFLGGAPLAQGTVWLLLKPKTAKVLTQILLVVVGVATIFALLSPTNIPMGAHLPSGRFFEWSWVRLFSPFINIYATYFLVGGAFLSAYRYSKVTAIGGDAAALARDRMLGNLLIAIGAIMPAVGGTGSRFGHTEYLYIGEFVGIMVIWLGYWYNIRHRPVVAQEA